jgi:hypothetical protein
MTFGHRVLRSQRRNSSMLSVASSMNMARGLWL